MLGAFAGAASAQSSVTLFGIVDVNARYVKNGDQNVKQLGTDGINSSRLGFRGVEDLGGGLKAGFWIEGALSPDNGTAGGQTWRRRSTVSLLGGFGEVRLGRDYTPTFWNMTVFDPFGTNGVGSLLNLVASGPVTTPLASGANTLVRADNSIGYFLPSGIGGLYGQAMVAAGEGTSGNKYAGGRIGYAAGPVDIATAYGQTQIAGDRKYKQFDLGGSFAFGPAKLTGQYIRMQSDLGGFDVKADLWQVGAIVALGQGELHAAYDQVKGKEDIEGMKARQFAVGYVYNLSKRTALYGTVSDLKNQGGTSFVVATPPAAGVNAKSRGFEAGLRHSF
ncbi:porin [Ideonella sp. BN130291]|uniref:porin n=1 Tax=Ideonella sp. BN130291 TaxID=3112940 RepID=UPI002E25C01A|nr:porin [Ideonella sp. BN130291]